MNQARESSRRLSDLLRSEHGAMADFLVALAEFDRQRLWLQLGFANLFDYLHRELGLSRGSAHYRKVAAQLVQRFPEVVEPLRSGKLCITVVLELAKVITPENRADVLPRFFHLSKQEAKAVAVEIRPAEVVPTKEMVTALPLVSRATAEPVQPVEREVTQAALSAAPTPMLQSTPLTPELRRLHMTVSKTFLEKLEAARKGQRHAQPGASAEKVLEAALDLLLAAQAKRRSEVKRPQQNQRPTKDPSHVPAAVRRAVWARDEGKCQWRLDSGGICGSTLRLEIDHVPPLARGGASTVEGCRLLCRVHNQYAARQVYGDDWMDLFTRGPGWSTPVAREAVMPWFSRQSKGWEPGHFFPSSASLRASSLGCSPIQVRSRASAKRFPSTRDVAPPGTVSVEPCPGT
jgi:5-methylcytosine-specific restriction endonuclease McrA